MIEGKNKTEAHYRAIELDSSSSLKDFSMDRKKYFKKYILGDSVEEKENQAANMGKLVETLLLEGVKHTAFTLIVIIINKNK